MLKKQALEYDGMLASDEEEAANNARLGRNPMTEESPCNEPGTVGGSRGPD